jgi:lantibiotic modifying enzyme
MAHVEHLNAAALPALAAGCRTTTSAIHGRIDHLCCGDAGRILALHDIGRGQDDADALSVARRSAAQMVQRAHERGHYRLTTNAHPLPRPGFLQGEAGIGYTLLATTHADVLPGLHLFL